MDAFGRILRTGPMVAGGLLALEATQAFRYPTIDPRSLRNAWELDMFHEGALSTTNNPLALYTQHASGGCVPICAAEITPARQVLWTYLIHAQSGNLPDDVTAYATNAANVYVCMMVHSGAASYAAARDYQDTYFGALDPGNTIPNLNALLIYGNHTFLSISRQAMIAVAAV